MVNVMHGFVCTLCLFECRNASALVAYRCLLLLLSSTIFHYLPLSSYIFLTPSSYNLTLSAGTHAIAVALANGMYVNPFPHCIFVTFFPLPALYFCNILPASRGVFL